MDSSNLKKQLNPQSEAYSDANYSKSIHSGTVSLNRNREKAPSLYGDALSIMPKIKPK